MFRTHDLAVIASFAIICSVASGCVVGGGNYSHLTRSITSPIRSTQMTSRGEVEASVTLHDVQTSNEFSTEDDAALLVPELEFGVNGRAGFAPGVYVGGHVNLAFTAHAGSTYAATTRPDPGAHVVFTGGPDMGIARPFGESDFSWGAFGSLTASMGSRFFEEADGSVGDVWSLMGFYRVGVAVHWSPLQELTWEVGVALQNYALADFNGALSLDRHGVVPYTGMRVTTGAGVYGYAQLHFPIGFEYTNASPVAGILGLGWTFGANPVRY